MVQYRVLYVDEICQELFKDFIRRQIVTKCWRKENGVWAIKDSPFIDDWTEKDYQILISCLKNTILSNGFVYAAFYDGKLKGFVSVEPEIFGGKQRYYDLSSIHVSEDMRNKGIGRKLFLAAKEWAKQKGAKLGPEPTIRNKNYDSAVFSPTFVNFATGYEKVENRDIRPAARCGRSLRRTERRTRANGGAERSPEPVVRHRRR